MQAQRYGVYSRLYDPGNPDDVGQPAWRITDSWADDIQKLGAKHVRFVLRSFANDNVVDTATFRTVAQKYVDRGIKLLAVLNGETFREGAEFPASGQSATKDAATFAPYVKGFSKVAGHVAGELAGVVDTFEIWNEPNADGSHMEPEFFGRLLVDSYEAMTAANAKVEIISGGLIYNDDAPNGFNPVYLTRVFDSPAIIDFFARKNRNPWDHLGFHPYHNPIAGNVQTSLQAVHDLQRACLDFTDIWVTEFGTRRIAAEFTGGSLNNSLSQADTLDRLYAQVLSKDFVSVAFWNKHEMNKDNPTEDPFGLTDFDDDVVPGTRFKELKINPARHWPAWNRLSERIQHA